MPYPPPLGSAPKQGSWEEDWFIHSLNPGPQWSCLPGVAEIS